LSTAIGGGALFGVLLLLGLLEFCYRFARLFSLFGGREGCGICLFFSTQFFRGFDHVGVRLLRGVDCGNGVFRGFLLSHF